MKKLSIIIPQYKETEEQIKPLFDMLNNQINVNFDDFEVVLVNDCSDTVISKAFLKQFKNLHIKSLRTPKNCGSGLTRQYGYDHTKSEYVMFVDADDTLYSLLVLHYVFSSLDCDLLQGQFLWEHYFVETRSYMYVRKSDVTWLHGKVYRRKFLDKYDIRFPAIRYSEDSFFNTVVYNLEPKIKAIDEPFVIYKDNRNSITRANNGDNNKSMYPQYIEAKRLTLEKLKPYVSISKYSHLAVQMVCQLYFDMQRRDWQHLENDAIDSSILLFFAEHQDDINLFSETQFNEIYQDVRDRFYRIKGFRECETISDFYTRLRKKYVKK